MPTGKRRGILASIMGIVSLFAWSDICFGQISWNLITTPPIKFGRIAFGNGQFVAISDRHLFTSPNGSVWTIRNLRGDKRPSSVNFIDDPSGTGNGKFVIVGDSCTIWTSIDGTTWTLKNAGPNQWLHSITYGNGIYVAVGTGGTILTSPDASTWTIQNSGTTAYLTSVAFGNGQFVAVGYQETILTSSDAATWTMKKSGVKFLNSVTYGRGPFGANGCFVAVGDSGKIVASTDAASWVLTKLSKPWNLYSVTYGAGRFVAVGDSLSVLTLKDSANWTLGFSAGGGAFTSVTYGDNPANGAGRFLAVDGQGRVAASLDGVTWSKIEFARSERSTQFISYAKNVSGGQGRFFITGRTKMFMTFADTTAWTISQCENDGSFLSIAGGKGLYVAVGATYGSGAGVVYSCSTDMVWKKQNSETEFKGLIAVTYGDSISGGASRFVAVGSQGTIVASPDGKTWTVKNSGTTYDLNAVTYAKKLFVAVGAHGAILTSPDAETWTLKNSGVYRELGGDWLYSITYGNNKFVAVGDSGRIFTSPDAVNWTFIPSGFTNEISSVCFGNGQFAAISPLGAIFTSVDAQTWTMQLSGAYITPWHIAYGNGQFVIVGYDERFLYSKTENSGLAFQPAFKNRYAGGIDITKRNNRILFALPFAPEQGRLKVTIYNVSGKRVFSEKIGFNKGIPSIAAGGFPSGMYVMSISDDERRTNASPFLLTK
jgi:hypothetical protein